LSRADCSCQGFRRSRRQDRRSARPSGLWSLLRTAWLPTTHESTTPVETARRRPAIVAGCSPTSRRFAPRCGPFGALTWAPLPTVQIALIAGGLHDPRIVVDLSTISQHGRGSLSASATSAVELLPKPSFNARPMRGARLDILEPQSLSTLALLVTFRPRRTFGASSGPPSPKRASAGSGVIGVQGWSS
jgi:hypothetical protein